MTEAEYDAYAQAWRTHKPNKQLLAKDKLEELLELLGISFHDIFVTEDSI